MNLTAASSLLLATTLTSAASLLPIPEQDLSLPAWPIAPGIDSGASKASADDSRRLALAPTNDTGPDVPPPLSLTLTPSARYQFESGLGAGRVSVLRGGLELSLFAPVAEKLSAAVSLKVEQSRYQWKNFNRIIPGVDRPLRDGTQLSFTPTLTFEIDDHWSVTGGALINFTAADGAEWSRSGTYGGIASIKYKFSESLSLSGGLGASSRLSDKVLVIPILGVEWQIDEAWRLETSGLGVRLSYKPMERVLLFLDGGYEFREYRLRRELGGGLGGGVLRDNAAIGALGVEWQLLERLTLGVSGGVALGGRTRFDNASGNEITRVHANAAPFVGVTLKWEF